MVKVILGAKGSGNTKDLIKAVVEAAKQENGSLVCIEKGNDLTYDLDYHVRLIDSRDYGIDGFTFLKGFLSGLHGGNFDVSHIFIDSLYKVADDTDAESTTTFLDWCAQFGERYNVSFTISVTGDPASAAYGIRKYC
ncbi:MAG: hypothetical protein VB055_01115 [Oscillospiraceae bacterium]|nr:hypothetical protein [Oscillospiraceae bacterium]